jgi:hypothetical protein
MGGGLSRGAVERLEALEDGDKAVAFLQALASRGRSSYTLRTYALGVAHFLEWLAARATRLADVERGDVVAYVADFARDEVDGVVLGRAAATVTHRVSVLASLFACLVERDQLAGGGAVGGRREPGAAGIDGHDRRARDAGSGRAAARPTRRAVPGVAHRMAARIEPAAVAALYASELGWRVVDELIQVRGGRGYETAESLKARGERPVPAERAMRDMRINRIFERSTEIIHRLIAREAVDQGLQPAGELLEGEGDLRAKARSAVAAGAFYARWLPKLAVGEGIRPGAFDDFRTFAGHLRYVERASRRLARSTFYAMGRWQAKLEKRQAVLGRIVDGRRRAVRELLGGRLYAETQRREHPARSAEATELADLFCRQARRRVDERFDALFDKDGTDAYTLAQGVLRGRFEWLE